VVSRPALTTTLTAYNSLPYFLHGCPLYVYRLPASRTWARAGDPRSSAAPPKATSKQSELSPSPLTIEGVSRCTNATAESPSYRCARVSP